MTAGAHSELIALIAEEKRAWDLHTPVSSEADLRYFAWRKANPKLDKEIADKNDLPAPMGELYRKADRLRAAASALSDRVCAWIPATVEEAAAMLEWQNAQGLVESGLTASVLVGLRAIARTEKRAGGGHSELVELFRKWRTAWRTSSTAELEDAERDRVGDELAALERRIFDARAGDARGLAIKAFLVAQLRCDGRSEDGEPRLDGFRPENYRADGWLTLDCHAIRSLVEALVELLPEVEPLCAAVLAAPARVPR